MRIARRRGSHDDAGLRGGLKEILRSGCTDKPVCGSGRLRPAPPERSRRCPDIPRALSRDPDNSPLEPRVAISRYAERVVRRYGADPAAVGMRVDFEHVGVVVELDSPIEIAVHDGGRTLGEGQRGVLDRFGPLVLRSASTRIVPNRIAYLQTLGQGLAPHESRRRCDLFLDEDVAAPTGAVLLEQP